MQEHGAHLHEHQVEAVNSLRQRWGQGESLLLADDSGLGRSTSFIVFVHSLRYAPSPQARVLLSSCQLSLLSDP